MLLSGDVILTPVLANTEVAVSRRKKISEREIVDINSVYKGLNVINYF